MVGVAVGEGFFDGLNLRFAHFRIEISGEEPIVDEDDLVDFSLSERFFKQIEENGHEALKKSVIDFLHFFEAAVDVESVGGADVRVFVFGVVYSGREDDIVDFDGDHFGVGVIDIVFGAVFD